eukprot:3015961-Pyramimonas_sp.AAC.1
MIWAGIRDDAKPSSDSCRGRLRNGRCVSDCLSDNVSQGAPDRACRPLVHARCCRRGRVFRGSRRNSTRISTDCAGIVTLLCDGEFTASDCEFG